MPEAETFDLPPEDAVPENGVAAERPPKEEHEPAFRKRGSVGQRQPPRPHNAPPRTFEESNAQLGKEGPKNDWPTKPGPLWLRILDWLPSQKIGEEIATVEDVMIGVERVSGGGQTGSVQLDPFEGVIAAGDESESPDAALQRVVTDSYHLPTSDRRSKASFRLTFYWRRGAKGTIKVSELWPLDSPENIRRSRAARGQESRDNSPLEPTPTTMANGRPIPQNTDPEILMELGRLREQTRAAGAAPATVSPPASTQPVDISAQLELARAEIRLQAEKEKAALELRIAQMESKSREDALTARFAALEARMAAGPQKTVAQEVVETLKALGIVVPGADGQPTVAVGAGQPYTAPGVTPMQQLIDASKVISESQKAGETTREVLRKTFGFTEPSTEIVKDEPEEKEEPGLLDKLAKGIGANLDVLAQMGLAGISPIADAVLVPGVAATVKTAVVAAQEQLAKKAMGRPAAQGQPGWQTAPKA